MNSFLERIYSAPWSRMRGFMPGALVVSATAIIALDGWIAVTNDGLPRMAYWAAAPILILAAFSTRTRKSDAAFIRVRRSLVGASPPCDGNGSPIEEFDFASVPKIQVRETYGYVPHAYRSARGTLGPAAWLTHVTRMPSPWTSSDVERAMRGQLAPWKPFAQQSPQWQCMALLFAMHCKNFDPATRESFRRSMDGGGPGFSPDGKAFSHWLLQSASDLASHATELVAFVDRFGKRHGTSETALMALLSSARRADALPCSAFLWLRETDYPLFMALNAVGRPSYHAASLAAACHFDEESYRGKLGEASVERAVETMLSWLGANGDAHLVGHGEPSIPDSEPTTNDTLALREALDEARHELADILDGRQDGGERASELMTEIIPILERKLLSVATRSKAPDA